MDGDLRVKFVHLDLHLGFLIKRSTLYNVLLWEKNKIKDSDLKNYLDAQFGMLFRFPF